MDTLSFDEYVFRWLSLIQLGVCASGNITTSSTIGLRPVSGDR